MLIGKQIFNNTTITRFLFKLAYLNQQINSCIAIDVVLI